MWLLYQEEFQKYWPVFISPTWMVIGKRNTCYRPVSWARVACKILQKHTITCVKQILEPCSKLELNHIWFIPSSNGESLSSFRNQFPTSSSQWSNLPSFMSAHRHDLRRRIRHGYPLSQAARSLWPQNFRPPSVYHIKGPHPFWLLQPSGPSSWLPKQM